MQIMLGETPALAAAPRRVGALRTAAQPGNVGDRRWLQGVVQWPEGGPGYRLEQDCATDQVDHGLTTDVAPIACRPFTIRTMATCPRRRDLSDLTDRATRQLEAITSQAIARELWLGEMTAADPWDAPAGTPFTLANPRPTGATATGPEGPWLNPYLADAELVGTATSPAMALGTAEAAASVRLGGGPVFLHVPMDVMTELSQFGLYREGDLIRTINGSIVVTDSGYLATPDDGDLPLVIYGTGPVEVWVGDPYVFDKPEEVVDVRNNRVGAWAQRPAAALFDPRILVGCPVTES